MKDKMKLNRACRYYLFRDRDVILNLSVFMLLIIGFNYLLFKGSFNSREDGFVILVTYTMMIGLFLISSNSMVVNLTVKDKLNKRIEFILASGVDIKDIVKAYAIEMWRISSIAPFLLFYSTYVLYDFKIDFKYIGAIFVTTILMLYFEILSFNIISLYRKNFKFFKNLLFFLTTSMIYIVGNFSDEILKSLNRFGIDIVCLIVSVNVVLLFGFGGFSIINLRRISNESVITREGTWS